MHKKVVWYILLAILLVPNADGQSWRTTQYELFTGIGTAHYFGDIGGTSADNSWYGIRDLDLLRTRPGFIAGLRYFQSDLLAFSGGMAIGWLSGSDYGGRNESREYVFNTVLVEPSARIEIFPIRDRTVLSGVDRRGLVRNYGTLSLYFFGGAGAAFYHVSVNDKLEERQERDNIDHGSAALVVPAGFGFKVGINNYMDLGIELGGRYTFTDYLDGFTSPTATSNDIYYLTTLQFVYRLDGF